MKNQLTKLKTRIKNQKGFTLIELMAVIAILAMIVLIAVPAVGSILAKAEKGSGEAHIAMIENAGELAAVGGMEPYRTNSVYLEDEFGDPVVDEDGESIVVGETRVYDVGSLIQAGYLNMDPDESNDQFMDLYRTYQEDYDPENSYYRMIVRELRNGTFEFDILNEEIRM